MTARLAHKIAVITGAAQGIGAAIAKVFASEGAHFASFPDPEAERRRQLDILPCKRFGAPREVANTALFLASDEATFINATDILIDGGRSYVYCD